MTMEATTVCQEIGQRLGALYVCEDCDDYVRIRTPFLYPDGDIIDLFLKEQNEVRTVTDLGETLRWLRMQSTSPRRSAKQQAMLEDLAETQGVEIFRGMLQARARSEDDLAEVVTRVAQASIRAADLWFTFRTRAVQAVTDEVEDFLQEEKIPFERGEKMKGRSGRTWTIDFHTRSPQKSSLVRVLSSGSRSVAKSMAESTVATWHDLSHLMHGPEALSFVSLFDDTADVWTDEDLRLVGDLSEVVYWSQPQQLGQALRSPH